MELGEGGALPPSYKLGVELGEGGSLPSSLESWCWEKRGRGGEGRVGLDVARRSEPLVEDAPEGPRRILAISTATQVAGSADGMSG